MAAKLNQFVVLLAVVGLCSATACGGSTASYTRFRRAASEGRVVRAEEVRAEDFLAYHATEDAPRPPLGTDLGAPVLLEARLGSSAMPLEGGRAAVQISLRGGVAAARYPSRLVVLVDVSGSMQEGDKIGAVRHALARFCERLDDQDQLAIVTFSDEAHVALAPSVVREERDAVLSAIGGLSAYGGTNLHAGLSEALRIADTMRRDGVLTRVLVLSDGVASVGITEPSAFEALARSAREREISITAVGMGDQIDFALLETLAHTAGGEFHYLDRPSEVERLFSTELVSLIAIAARDVRVRVRVPPGWTLAQSYAERTHYVEDVLETPIGDLPSDGAFVVLHELLAPPSYRDVAVQIEVVLTLADGRTDVVATANLPITFRPGPSAAIEDLSVLRNLTLGRSAVALREASARNDAGDPRGARDRLRSARIEAEAAQTLLQARGDEARAASLSEPIELLGRTLAALPETFPEQGADSSRFAGWR